MEGIAKNLVVDIWDQLEFMASGKDWDFFLNKCSSAINMF